MAITQASDCGDHKRSSAHDCWAFSVLARLRKVYTGPAVAYQIGGGDQHDLRRGLSMNEKASRQLRPV
jgi:hypothetical protein